MTDQDQEKMDRLLHQVMTAEVPRLSPSFDAKLARRLRPRRLSRTARLVLTAYTLLALAGAVWTMRSAAIDWGFVAPSVLLPLAFVEIVYRRHLTRWG